MHQLRILLITFLTTMLVGCKSKPDLLFTQLHLDFENTIQETPEVNILSYEYTYNGGGVAAADFNNDGLCDLYFTGNTVSNKLFLNEGALKFKDVTTTSGAGGRPLWKTGVTTADVNADGWLDIYVCYSGPELGQSFSNQLFINNGTGPDGTPTFTERAAEYGLDASGTFSTQALFFDFDRDGDLDMFLVNHANHFFSPFVNTSSLRNSRHPQFGNRLYRNDSNGKIFFTDISEKAGIHGGGINFGLGVSASDLNADGWPDLYISNDYEEQDFLYLNNQDGTFRNVTQASLGHFSRNGMGTDIADYNNDGLPDIAEVDMWPEDNYRQKLLKGPDDYNRYQLMLDSGFLHQQMRNTLQLNTGVTKQGVPVFSEVGQLASVSSTDWSWAPLFIDLDNDGYKDLFVSNGYLRDFTSMDFLKYTVEDARTEATRKGEQLKVFELVSKMASTKTKDYVFRNKGNLTFENVTDAWGLSVPNLSFGATYADLDNDGDLEIITNNTNEPATIWQNNAEALIKNSYLSVQLSGSKSNPFAIGAKVYVQTPTQTLLLEQFFSRGFQSAVDPVLHFGLGKDDVVNLKVIWPDSLISEIKNVATNQRIKVEYSEAIAVKPEAQTQIHLFEDITDLSNLSYRHRENNFVDFDREPLLLKQLSRMGPAVACADVNADGHDDFFVGGAVGQSGVLFLGTGKGQFVPASSQPWQADKQHEDVSAVFFDADNDGDQDLFVVSGGNEFPTGSEFLDDRLYVNLGKGKFEKASAESIVADHANGNCVAAADYDQDGDIDLFIGGAAEPGNFPYASPGAILKNETDRKTGKIKFSVATLEVNAELRLPGVVTDAVWADFNQDSWPDLVLVGDWMPVRIFENKKGKLVAVNLEQQTSGWWNRIVAGDIDQDGDLDFVLGNAGNNLPWKVSKGTPLTLYYGDFDNDGKTDPMVFYGASGKSYPVASRDEMLRQLPFLKKKFTTYSSYAWATLNEILDQSQQEKAMHVSITNLHSGILENLGNSRFRFNELPIEAQVSPIQGISIDDFDGDEIQDILVAGNFYSFHTQFGPSDAGKGLLLKGVGNKTFTPIGWNKLGFYSSGDVRNMKILTDKDGVRFVVQVRNNDSLSVFKINKHEPKNQ